MINLGTVGANVSGGNVVINASVVLNQGTLDAFNGGGTTVMGVWTNTGSIVAVSYTHQMCIRDRPETATI